MLKPTAVSSAMLLTLPLDDTRDRPMSARYNGGVDAEPPHTHTHYTLHYAHLMAFFAGQSG